MVWGIWPSAHYNKLLRAKQYLLTTVFKKSARQISYSIDVLFGFPPKIKTYLIDSVFVNLARPITYTINTVLKNLGSQKNYNIDSAFKKLNRQVFYNLASVFGIVADEDDENVAILEIPWYYGIGTNILKGKEFIAKKITLADTDVIKRLRKNAITQAGGAKSLELHMNTTDYAVTSGKTAQVYFLIEGGASGTQFQIIEDSTADAGTGTVLDSFTGPVLEVDTLLTVGPYTFTAGKYVTIKVTSASDSLHAVAIAIES